MSCEHQPMPFLHFLSSFDPPEVDFEMFVRLRFTIRSHLFQLACVKCGEWTSQAWGPWNTAMAYANRVSRGLSHDDEVDVMPYPLRIKKGRA